MIRKFFIPTPLPEAANWGVLLLRLGMCPPFMVYGYSKLENYLRGERGFADPIGVGEELTLLLAIVAEFVCPLFIMAGFVTRAALIPPILTMLVAFVIVHSQDSWDHREHPLLYLIPFLTLLFTGPGRFSADHRLFDQGATGRF